MTKPFHSCVRGHGIETEAETIAETDTENKPETDPDKDTTKVAANIRQYLRFRPVHAYTLVRTLYLLRLSVRILLGRMTFPIPPNRGGGGPNEY